MCGSDYQGRTRTCSPECGRVRSAQAPRRRTTRDLTDDERAALLADPDTMVYVLGDQGVGRAYMAAALGIDPSRVSIRWPQRDRPEADPFVSST